MFDNDNVPVKDGLQSIPHANYTFKNVLHIQ